MLSYPSFAPLLDTAGAITAVLDQTRDITTPPEENETAPMPAGNTSTNNANPFKDRPNFLDAPINTTLVPILNKHNSLDKAALLEAAFKLKLISIQDDLATSMIELKDATFRCLDLLLRCSELELIDPFTPLNYIEEVLDFQTVEYSEHIYDYLESRVKRLTVNMVAGRGKGLTLLRLCNELLRRLSKAKNTVYCGRILMLLSSVFPLTERSGVNLRGDFNTENVTLIEGDDVTVVPDFTVSPPESQKDTESSVPGGESMDVDKDPPKGQDNEQAKKSRAFYTEFWGLQAFFCNPPTLISSPDNLTKLQRGIEHTLERFAAVEESEQKMRGQRAVSESSEGKPTDATSGASESSTSQVMDQTAKSSGSVTTKRKQTQNTETIPETTTYFPKFLTSPKLLQLEIADPYFRKHILVQFLIIIQYLESHTAAAKEAFAKISTPNKSFQPQWIMEEKDQEWAASIKTKISKELKAIGSDNGDKDLLSTVNAVLSHESSWLQWKAESCHSFEKPPLTKADVEETRRKRQKLSAALAPLKQKMGCYTLTELWREVEEQTDEDTGFGSNRPPRTVDEYLSGLPFAVRRAQAMRLREGKPAFTEQETKSLEQARLWRGLRLGARQYLHLYGKSITDPNYTVATLTADVKKDEEWEEEIKENGGKVPSPKIPEATSAVHATTGTSQSKSTSETSSQSEDKDQSEFSMKRSDSDVDMKETDVQTEAGGIVLDDADEDNLANEEQTREVPPSTATVTEDDGSVRDNTTEMDTPMGEGSAETDEKTTVAAEMAEPIVISLTKKGSAE